MPDYKSMYYHLAGWTANTVDVLEATTRIMEANAEAMMASAQSLSALKDKLKAAHRITEEMFINGEDDDSGEGE